MLWQLYQLGLFGVCSSGARGDQPEPGDDQPVRDSLGPWLYVVLFAIIFAETGLVVTPFLPGDSLLFAVGAVAAHSWLTGPDRSDWQRSWWWRRCWATPSITRSDTWSGPEVFSREKSRLLNKKHLVRAHEVLRTLWRRSRSCWRGSSRSFERSRRSSRASARMSYRRFCLVQRRGRDGWILLFPAGRMVFGGQIPWSRRTSSMVIVRHHRDLGASGRRGVRSRVAAAQEGIRARQSLSRRSCRADALSAKPRSLQIAIAG